MNTLEKNYKVVESKELNINDYILTKSGSLKIKSIKQAGVGNCYDITLLKDNNLFMNEPNFILSNGVISHNCNLQVMNDAAKLVEQRHDITIDWTKVDLDEKEVYENIIQVGDAMGLFQFEAGFVINMLKNIKPRNFEQFAAISALLRPGPLHMGMDKEFACRVNGIPDSSGNVWKEEDIPEAIRDILAPTKGIIIYQEQYMKIAEKIGGFSVKETNKLRKDLTKGGKKYDIDPEVRKKIDNHKKKFIKHAAVHLGDEEAEKLFDLIFSFSSYGFNKCIYFKETVQDRNRGIITLEDVQNLKEKGEDVWVKSADENGDDIWVEVVDVHDNGVKDLVEVEMEDGTTIRCTLDHKFKTPEGMLPLEEIISRDLEILGDVHATIEGRTIAN